MIAAWMLYTLLISALLLASAIPAEFVCRALRWPTRFVWCAALAMAILLSALALYRIEFGAVTRDVRREIAASPTESTRSIAAGTATTSTRAALRQPVVDRALGVARAALRLLGPLTSMRDLRTTRRVDVVLATTAALAAIAALSWLATLVIRVRRFTRRLRPQLLDGHRVLVSENVGPAIIGVARPAIVVPAWLLSMNEAKRRVILSHEQQHADAFDPAMLAVAAVLLALEVWNVALWAIVERLRAAIEIDCDQRVVRAHGDARGYGELLLAVYEQNSSGLRRQLAFLGRQSNLELRIRRVVARAPRVTRLRSASGLVASVLLVAVACETSAPTRSTSDSAARQAAKSPAPAMALATTQPSCLGGSDMRDVNKFTSLARQRHPEVFANARRDTVIIGLILDENCVVQRDTVVRASGYLNFRGLEPLFGVVVGDTSGFARRRGVAFGNAATMGRVAVVWGVKPSAEWNARVAGTQCGFGLRTDEVCRWQGPLVIRMVDSVRALIAVRGFNAPNQPADRLFLITLSRPVEGLLSQSLRHAIVNEQAGTVYVEDFLATQPLLLFAPSSSAGLASLKTKRDVRIIRDLIGVAQYGSVKLTLEQVDRLQANHTCDGPRGSCYQVDGIKIEFPA